MNTAKSGRQPGVCPRTRCALRRSPLLLGALALLLPSCESGGNFTILGYTTRPNYDTSIHTVYVPIFKNLTFWRGLEFDLTRAVVREIEEKTPYKVVSDPHCADTQLTGTIISFNKNILNRTPLNEIREGETTLGVEVVWKDLRTGEILSRPRPPSGPFTAVPSLPGATTAPDGSLQPVPIPPPGGSSAPPPLPPGTPVPPPPPPVLVQSIGGFIPELGQSLTTAQYENVNRLAVQIVSMMEMPW